MNAVSREALDQINDCDRILRQLWIGALLMCALKSAGWIWTRLMYMPGRTAEQALTGGRAGTRNARCLNRPRFDRQDCESPIFWRISPWSPIVRECVTYEGLLHIAGWRDD